MWGLPWPAQWNPSTIQSPSQLALTGLFARTLLFSLKWAQCSHHHSCPAKQACTFLSLSLPPLFPLPLIFPHSLQNPMHPSRTNSNAMSSLAFSSASWYEMNCPACGFTCHFSIPLVYFNHHFYVHSPWVIVNYPKAAIMSYHLCIPSISWTLPGINVHFLERYSRKKSSFLSFILNEILKFVFKTFLDAFLFCSNSNFEDWITWKATT